MELCLHSPPSPHIFVAQSETIFWSVSLHFAGGNVAKRRRVSGIAWPPGAANNSRSSEPHLLQPAYCSWRVIRPVQILTPRVGPDVSPLSCNFEVRAVSSPQINTAQPRGEGCVPAPRSSDRFDNLFSLIHMSSVVTVLPRASVYVGFVWFSE